MRTPQAKTLLPVVLGKSWWVRNITNKGVPIESISSWYGLSQLISEPTHILQNSSSSIDLIFTDQPSLVINSGIKPSLHENCHHQITHMSNLTCK